jgi:hypothetical protein
MTHRILICIATYGKRIRNQLILGRLLNSMTRLPKDQFRVLIVNTNAPHNPSVTEQINKVIAKFSTHSPKLQITQYDVDFLRDVVVNNGFNGVVNHINFRGYSNFRNIMLLVAQSVGAKMVFMIDDDEVIENRQLIQRAKDFMGAKVHKQRLYGKTGHYINENGSPYLRQQSPKKRTLWLKETYINEALKLSITKKSRLNKTTMAFGGIMVLHEKLFSKVPFDPNIKRGEDTDYAINARQFGFQFLLDKRLRARHLPPKKHVPYWDKLRQDIVRFIYEKEKLNYFNRIELKSLEPYPAVFLKDDLEYRAVVTAVNYAKRALKRKDYQSYKESFRNVELVYKEAKLHAVIRAARYFEFQKQWVSLMNFVKKNKELRRHFSRFE